jgi:hypothetical protein
MENPRQSITVTLVLGFAFSSFAGTNPPLPAPTPKPGTLAFVAGGRSLIRAGDADLTEPIVITDENLGKLAEGAVITVVTTTVAEPPSLSTADSIDPKTREKWRRKVLAQSQTIAKLEAKRTTGETEINRLERGRLDAGTLDRIAKAEAKLKAIDQEIQRKKAEFSRIVRQARKEGAQPGWFR